MIERRWIVKNRHRVAFCFFAFVCFFCLISPLICGPLEDGLAAYEKEDYESAFRLLQPFAEQGNADAQKCLGYMYDTGQGVPQDYAEAIKCYKAMKWYRKAAEQRFVQAQANLGFMYFNGFGVQQNDVEAVGWYRKSAEQGYAWAQNDLGEM